MYVDPLVGVTILRIEGCINELYPRSAIWNSKIDELTGNGRNFFLIQVLDENKMFWKVREFCDLWTLQDQKCICTIRPWIYILSRNFERFESFPIVHLTLRGGRCNKVVRGPPTSMLVVDEAGTNTLWWEYVSLFFRSSTQHCALMLCTTSSFGNVLPQYI